MTKPKLSLAICREAEDLIALSGEHALQILVDRAVNASRNKGSELELSHIDALISAVTERLHSKRSNVGI